MSFQFRPYEYNNQSGVASFHYGFSDSDATFTERIQLSQYKAEFSTSALERALFLAHIIIGISYYKTFPTKEVELLAGECDEWQAHFFNTVYQEGLGQYAYENELRRQDLAHFRPSVDNQSDATTIEGQGIIALQSGGKDSLLTAQLLSQNGTAFVPWYISSSTEYPGVLDTLGAQPVTVRRELDHQALLAAKSIGAKNGHIPVTYIVQSIAVIQAILSGKAEVLVSIAHEGEELHAWINDLPVNHQWSKTWQAEQLFSEYVKRYIASDLRIGSPLRRFSELRVAELFTEHAWGDFGHQFSSCNISNYKQGADNSELTWCGECSKCANSYLLFAPFLPKAELASIFDGSDLFEKAALREVFKGLLGIDGVMKPFECVGEIDELRLAYHMALKKGEYSALPFEVPPSSFDYRREYAFQSWASV